MHIHTCTPVEMPAATDARAHTHTHTHAQDKEEIDMFETDLGFLDEAGEEEQGCGCVRVCVCECNDGGIAVVPVLTDDEMRMMF